jgi:hypothetical protein
MAKAKEAVDAQGWCRPNENWPEHYFTDAYPACGWKLPIQTNENGRCIKCERAAQAAKQGEQP